MTPAELRARYEAGATLLELAAETGRSYGTIQSTVVAAGTTMRPARIALPPLPPGMVDAYVNEGQSLTTVGVPWGLSRDQARRMLLAAGVTLRPRGRPRRSSGGTR